MFNTPILYLFFNRPDLTEITFSVICKIKPSMLFIAADGPRINVGTDFENCILARDIVLRKIDWDCQVEILFRDKNLGCGKAVSSAINWFFEHVDKGIILEDDCLPDLSFFRYCEELLEFYEFDQDVMTISGSNLLGNSCKKIRQSYFWGLGGIWGWATWKRAWEKYDYTMVGYSQKDIKYLTDYLGDKKWAKEFDSSFNHVSNGIIDTWDIQWVYSIFINKGFCVNPSVNLVANLGFGKDATHTYDSKNFISKLKSNEILFPLIHPLEKKIDRGFINKLFFKLHISNNILSRILYKIKFYLK